MSGSMNVRRCGGCYFAKLMPQDLTKRICWGAPPSATQTLLPGGQQMTLQMVRPIVNVSDDACALWQAKDAEQIAHDQDSIKMMQSTDHLVGFKQ